MNISPEYLIERKKTKLQLLRWKFAALIAVITSIFLFISGDSEDSVSVTKAVSVGGEYVAAIEINGIILEDLNLIRKLSKIANDDKIKAVIVHINSPGGSSAGSELVYKAFRKISEQKPIVSVMGSVAASGAYKAALGTDYIFCQNGTITGSIGVIMQSAEITDLAENLGIKFENFKTSELKAAPNPLEKTTPAVREAIISSIQDNYDYFIELLMKNRKMDLRSAREIADGRIYTGRQALKINLVDQIGFEGDALKWLQDNRNIGNNINIRQYKLRDKLHFFDSLLDDLGSRINNSFSLKLHSVQSLYN